MVRTAYMSGPLSGLPEPEVTKAFYEAIAVGCAGAGVSLYLPHEVSDPILRPELTPRQVYNMDRAQIERSELVIAYIGVPSLGVGCEVEIAHALEIPVLLLYERGVPLSRMLRGNPAVVGEICFDDYEDAPCKVTEWLHDWDHRR